MKVLYALRYLAYKIDWPTILGQSPLKKLNTKLGIGLSTTKAISMFSVITNYMLTTYLFIYHLLAVLNWSIFTLPDIFDCEQSKMHTFLDLSFIIIPRSIYTTSPLHTSIRFRFEIFKYFRIILWCLMPLSTFSTTS